MAIFRRIFAALSIASALSAIPAHASVISGPFTVTDFPSYLNGNVTSVSLSGTALTLDVTLSAVDFFEVGGSGFVAPGISFNLFPTAGTTEYTVSETVTNNAVPGIYGLSISLFQLGPLTIDTTHPPTSPNGWALRIGSGSSFISWFGGPSILPGESATFTFNVITCDACSGTDGIGENILTGAPEPATGAIGLAGLGLLILARRIKRLRSEPPSIR